MSTSILFYLILLIAGGFLSYKGFIHKNLVKKAGSIQLFFLYILIFIMGLRIGLDRKIIEAIYSIGFKALVYALFTVLFSGGAVLLTSKYIIKSHPKGEIENDS